MTIMAISHPPRRVVSTVTGTTATFTRDDTLFKMVIEVTKLVNARNVGLKQPNCFCSMNKIAFRLIITSYDI